jgi:Protein of unknown function (DUF1579)
MRILRDARFAVRTPRAIAASMLVLMTLVAAPVLVSTGRASMTAQADPEHARLTAMCGTWDVEMTFWFKPGAPGVTTKATSTIRPLFDGRFIEEKIEGTLNGTPFTTLAWTGFNTSTREYEATRIATTNTARIAETGSYDESTKQFELQADYPLAGETWHERTVIQPSADTMIARSYLSFGNVPEWTAVEIRYTRQPIAKSR